MTWLALLLCGPVFLLAVWGIQKQVRIRLDMARWEARQRTAEWEERWWKRTTEGLE